MSIEIAGWKMIARNYGKKILAMQRANEEFEYKPGKEEEERRWP